MENLPELAEIRDKARRRQYRLSVHAEQERDADKITLGEIQEALVSDRAEVIENYPQDARGRSCLILGLTNEGRPLHVVCGLGRDDMVLVTVYRPDPQKWTNWRLRRTSRP